VQKCLLERKLSYLTGKGLFSRKAVHGGDSFSNCVEQDPVGQRLSYDLPYRNCGRSTLDGGIGSRAVMMIAGSLKPCFRSSRNELKAGSSPASEQIGDEATGVNDVDVFMLE
jgi:hypothetical protein